MWFSFWLNAFMHPILRRLSSSQYTPLVSSTANKMLWLTGRKTQRENANEFLVMHQTSFKKVYKGSTLYPAGSDIPLSVSPVFCAHYFNLKTRFSLHCVSISIVVKMWVNVSGWKWDRRLLHHRLDQLMRRWQVWGFSRSSAADAADLLHLWWRPSRARWESGETC